ARIELVDRFDADVGIGVRGLGLRAELVKNSHWSFRPRRPEWAGRCLPSCLLLQQLIDALLEHSVRLCADDSKAFEALCGGFAYEKRRGAVDAETGPFRHVPGDRRVVLSALDARVELLHVQLERCGLLGD